LPQGRSPKVIEWTSIRTKLEVCHTRMPPNMQNFVQELLEEIIYIYRPKRVVNLPNCKLALQILHMISTADETDEKAREND
jgi:hypothetical protein